MPWVILVLALAVVTSVLIIAYGYRRALIVMSMIVGLGLGFLIWYGERGNRGGSDFPPEAVRLDTFSVTRVYGGSFKLTARVANDSPDYKLTRFGLTLTATDCSTENGERTCAVVGEQTRDVYIVVPPAQARDFTEQYQFGNMRPKGELNWSHRIHYVRGE